MDDELKLTSKQCTISRKATVLEKDETLAAEVTASEASLPAGYSWMPDSDTINFLLRATSPLGIWRRSSQGCLYIPSLLEASTEFHTRDITFKEHLQLRQSNNLFSIYMKGGLPDLPQE